MRVSVEIDLKSILSCPAKSQRCNVTFFIDDGLHMCMSIPSVGVRDPLPLVFPRNLSANPQSFFILLTMLVFPTSSFPTTTTLICRVSENNSLHAVLAATRRQSSPNCRH